MQFLRALSVDRLFLILELCFILLSFDISYVRGDKPESDKTVDDVKNHPGHGKPFGSSGPFLNLEELTEISSGIFFDKYVRFKKPLILRKQVLESNATKLWTDKYLYDSSVGHDHYKIVVETEKKENRDQEIINLSFREFLLQYKEKEIYMVNAVPYFLKKDIFLPQPLQCDPAPNTLEETMMWFSSGGTKSVLHTDDYENILCIYDGIKELVLVDYYKFRDLVNILINEPKGSFSNMDVDKVDYELFPGIEKLEYYKVNLSAGDCLYIPFRWMHQVRSYDRNLAVNFWFNYEKIFGEKFSENCYNNKIDFSRTLDLYNYTSSKDDLYINFKHFLMRQVNFGNRLLDDWKNLLLNNVSEEGIEKLEEMIKEIFNLMDFDGNGEIGDDEILELDEMRLEHAAGLLDEIEDLIQSEYLDNENDDDPDEDSLNEINHGSDNQKTEL